MKRSGLELVQRHAVISATEKWNAAIIRRNVYKNDGGRYVIKYNGATRYVYLSKTYDANYGWFLCR